MIRSYSWLLSRSLQRCIIYGTCLCMMMMVVGCGSSSQPQNAQPTLPAANVTNTALSPQDTAMNSPAMPSATPVTAIPPRPVRTGVILTTPIPTGSPFRSPSRTPTPTTFVEEETPTATPTAFVEEEMPTATPTAFVEEETPTPVPTIHEEEQIPTPTVDETDDEPLDTTPTLDARPVLPNLVGNTEYDARNRLTRLDATIQIETVDLMGGCQNNGIVMNTTPSAGTPLNPGSRVVLHVCVVPTPTAPPINAPLPAMPAVVGIDETTALNMVYQADASASVEVVYQVDTCATDGVVVNTLPPVGSRFEPGSHVVLTVCLQPTPEPEPSGPTMPSVIGMHPDDAMRILREMGIDMSFYEYSQDCSSQTVVITDPPAGQPVASVVSIGVCTPPNNN